MKCFMQSTCYLVIYEALMLHGWKKSEHFLVDSKLLEAIGFQAFGQMKERVLFELLKGEQTTRPHTLKSGEVYSHSAYGSIIKRIFPLNEFFVTVI